jgi:ssDNA thymidine ADP-ribosyltransferase, DarT
VTNVPTLSELFAAHKITRLCHFSPSRNLPHIFRDGELRATKDLVEDVRAVYMPTDLARLDGHREKICCTIEYPNAYYWNKAKAAGEARLFPHWAVLLIDPDVALQPETLFCTGNAARNYGAGARSGTAGFQAAYAPAVEGSGGRTFTRGTSHLIQSPTDMQAEVLVPGPISLDALQGIVVATVEQAETEAARLRQLALDIDRVNWVVAPTFFEPYRLTGCIQGGAPPNEQSWHRKESRS